MNALSKAMNKEKAICVIPARWGSTRFPGKSLHPILGRPLVQWVYERARQARVPAEVVVATDDTRIFDAVAGFGGRAVMTRGDHASGTDRVAEVARGSDAEVVVNAQGDEPMLEPGLIDELALALSKDSRWDMATAATPITSAGEAGRADVCKVVFDFEGRALYFSRSVIPYVRDVPFEAVEGETLWWRHIGIYAYRSAFLEKLASARRPAAERAESLEQLRALHLGAAIKVCPTGYSGRGVDRPEDAAEVEALMKTEGKQWYGR